jgi:cell division protease FtsH
MDEEINTILRQQETRAIELLSKHRIGLDLVAQALLEKETIDGDLVNALVQQGLDGNTQFPISVID